MKFSIVIPARDEEKRIGACLDSIARAARRAGVEPEIIVVLNRCSDATEAIARARGAAVVRDDARNLAHIRNTGARTTTGDILITVDADSVVSENTLERVGRALASGRTIGGGVPIFPERFSLGILLTVLFIWAVLLLPHGIGGGLFWCRRADFEAVGGFNEELLVAEDLDFAKRLKALGRKRGKRFKNLWGASITTSCRKFDRFGDWFVFRMLLTHPAELWKAVRWGDRAFADRYFYDFKR
jgi:glycosyltransferase involved in cell wall biosynthesis